MRRISDFLSPLSIALILAAVFGAGLLWPLGRALSEALTDPAQQESLAPGEHLSDLARRSEIPEAELRALNGLGAKDEPAPGATLTLRESRWTLDYVLGLFAPAAPQWRWLLNSLGLAVTVTLLCTLLAYPLAYLQTRTTFRGQAWLGGLLLLPLILPPFVSAIGLRRVLARYGCLNMLLHQLGWVSLSDPIDFLGRHRFAGMVAVMVLHYYPLIYLNLCASMSQVDPALLDAARSLGRTPWQVFRKVLLPLSIPGLVAGGSLVFIGAFTDLGTPLVFAYQEVVAQQIFSLANEQSANPAAPALVGVVLALVMLLFALTRICSARYRAEGGIKGASRATPRPLTGAAAWGATALYVAVIGIAIIPHLSVALTGLAERWFMTGLPESWTLLHLKEAMAHETTLTGVRNSLLYAMTSTFGDLLLGLACAWVVVRRGGWWGRTLDLLTLAPLAVPGVVLAFSYVGAYGSGLRLPEWLAGATGVTAGRVMIPASALLILSYLIRRLPYTTRACVAGLEQIPVTLEEAARGLGARPLAVISRCTAPLLAGHLIAGGILAFSFAMLEVSDSLILAKVPRDFPLTKSIYYLFGRLGDGDQLASALGLFAMLFLGLALLAAGAFMGRKWGEAFRG